MEDIINNQELAQQVQPSDYQGSSTQVTNAFPKPIIGLAEKIEAFANKTHYYKEAETTANYLSKLFLDQDEIETAKSMQKVATKIHRNSESQIRIIAKDGAILNALDIHDNNEINM